MENPNEPKATPAKANNKKPNKTIIVIVIIAAICIIAGIIAAVIINNNSNNTEGSNSSHVLSKEEEQKITEDTLSKYADVTIEGYQTVDNPNTEKAVVVKVENKSEETTSLAVTIGAYDENNKLLEKSSTYAENIGPGQSVIFHTFVYTDLTEDQLNSATYKVYSAKTYTVNGLVEETGEETKE